MLLKIVFMLTMAFFFVPTVTFASPKIAKEKQQNLDVTSLQRLLNVTPHEYTELTGKKMNFGQVVKLKLTQQFFKHQILKSKSLDDEPKSQIIAFLICLLVGFLGIHRYYLGYTAIGVLQTLTFGGCLIWWIIDIILILSGTLGPADGSDYYPTFEDL